MEPKDVALERYRTIEPYLLNRCTLAEIAKQSGVGTRTLYRWVTAFADDGLNGLTPKARRDKGQRRSVSSEIKDLIQGLYLRTPPVTARAIYRAVCEVCQKNKWRKPSYDVVHEIIAEIPPPLKTLAHEGLKAYKQAFGLIHRFEADRPNEIWQADHSPLDILVLNSKHEPIKPWLTVIIDDYSRAVPGYFLGFQPPSSMRVATALRQAIWHKDHENWKICGIPEKFYSDQGSDFTSSHVDQISIDLKFETIHTEPGDPQGKGKCERFFLTVNEMLLSSLPGYSPAGENNAQAILTLEQLEERFRQWLLTEYMTRIHSEINTSPKDRWESFPLVPRLPESLEQLDLLLLTVTKSRRVRRDGIRFSGFRYMDAQLNGYVGEDVTIRFDPRDLSYIHVYKDNVLVCKAQCFELSGRTMSLQEVRKARNLEAKSQRTLLNELLATADKHTPRPHFEAPPAVPPATPTTEYPRLKIRRFACDLDRESKTISDDTAI